MDKELENRINDTASPLKIELNGEIRLTPQRDNSFIIGKTYVKSLIEITPPRTKKGSPRKGLPFSTGKTARETLSGGRPPESAELQGYRYK